MRLHIAALAICLSSARATLELTPENWDDEVVNSGKATFVKFLAPW